MDTKSSSEIGHEDGIRHACPPKSPAGVSVSATIPPALTSRTNACSRVLPNDLAIGLDNKVATPTVAAVTGKNQGMPAMTSAIIFGRQGSSVLW